MRNRLLIPGAVVASVVVAAVVISQFAPMDAATEKKKRQQAYAEMLANHPYNMTAEELSAIPKAENPAERFRQDYLLTMDPATQTVPLQRLIQANEEIAAQKRSGILAASMSWTERGPDDVGGRTRAIMFDPNDGTNSKVWAGGVSGGLWYTNDITDAGEAWNSVDDFWANLAVTAMAYDPTNTNVFYVGTGEGFFNADAVLGGGVFKSTDAGATWSQLASTSPTLPSGNFAGIQDLIVTAAGTVLVSTREGAGVQRSTDGGTSFSIVLNGIHTGGTSRAADLEIAANGDIWASMGIFSTSGVWKSTDDGATWTQMNTGTNGFPTSGFSRVEIATAPSDANVVYALTHDSATNGIGAIYRSGDAGANWVSMPLPADCDVITITAGDFTRGQAWYDLIAVVNPTDPNDVTVGGIDIFRTTNGSADSGSGAGSGATWGQSSIWLNPASLGCTLSPAPPVVHADHHQMVYRPGSSTEVVFGHDGGIDYTADVTATPYPTFVNRNNGYNVTQFYAGSMQSLSNDLMFGGTQDNGSPQLNSAGIGTSFGDATGGDGGFSHINQATNVLAMGANTGTSLHRSLDGGVTFGFIGSLGGCTASFINPSDLDDGTDELFVNCGTALGHVFNLVSGTIGARTIVPGGGLIGTPTHIRTSPYGSVSSATVYMGTNSGAIHRVEDAQDGGTPVWSVIDTTPLPVGSISSIDFGAGEDTLLVTFSNYGVASVWETFDGGATWNDRDTGSSGLGDVPVRWGMYNPNNRSKVMLATEVGVVETDDITAGTVVWSTAASFPTVRVDMLRYRAVDDVVLAATHGRGLWTGAASTLPVELTAFNHVTDGNDVTLMWNTASETSNAGFEIEHARGVSASRSANDLTFSKVVFVEGNGTTTEAQAYSHTISDLEPGSHTFRLKQINLDGSFDYSASVEVDITIPGAALLTQAYPNPFSHEAKVSLTVASAQDVDVYLYDMQGRRVATLYSGPVEADRPQEIVVKADGLASGQYIYRAIGSSFSESKTISLIK